MKQSHVQVHWMRFGGAVARRAAGLAAAVVARTVAEFAASEPRDLGDDDLGDGDSAIASADECAALILERFAGSGPGPVETSQAARRREVDRFTPCAARR